MLPTTPTRMPLAAIHSNPPSPHCSPAPHCSPTLNRRDTSPAPRAAAQIVLPDLICDEEMPTLAEIYAGRASPDLACHQRMPSLAEIYAEQARADAEACWCLDQCPPSAPCRRARPVHVFPHARASRKRKASPPPSRETAPALKWVQPINLWHASDFQKTLVEMDCNLSFRAVFDELCRDERVPRANVQFVWARKRSAGAVQLVVLKDSDTPLDVGMRFGAAPETVEADFI